MPINLHFDLLAPIYERVIPPPEPDRLAELLRLPINGWLLDAGGGTGRVSMQLRSLVGRLVISDLSQPMLKQAQEKLLCCPVQAVAETLPFSANLFDRIVVVDALHHFRHQRHAIGDLLRVLKPGGRLVIEEPDINRFPVKLVALAEKLALMGSHFHSPLEIQAIARSFGATAAIEQDDGFAAWVIVDKQPIH